jgi:hypothetical protein
VTPVTDGEGPRPLVFELAREVGMERCEVIEKCLQLGVPIRDGRIDKALFLAANYSKLSELADDPDRTAAGLIKNVTESVVGDRLSFNVRAYGKAWTGEDADTEFVCQGIGEAVIERLRECGLEIRRVAG